MDSINLSNVPGRFFHSQFHDYILSWKEIHRILTQYINFKIWPQMDPKISDPFSGIKVMDSMNVPLVPGIHFCSKFGHQKLSTIEIHGKVSDMMSTLFSK